MNAQCELVLRGGMLVDEQGVHERDLLISKGRIVAHLMRGEQTATAKELDVSGRYVLPGLVDAHVHFREPGMTWKEDFESGSRSAIAGGITTALVMPTDDPWTVSAEDLEAKRELTAGRIHCDIGLQATLRHDGETARGAADAGAVSVEVFTADVPHDFLHDSPARLVNALIQLKEVGIRIAVSPGDQSLLTRALRGMTHGRSSACEFVASRPALAEAIGVTNIILAAAAADVPVHIRQINSKLGIEVLRRLRHLASISAETSPQNWSFTKADYGRLGPSAKASPPFRENEDRMAVLEALVNGDIDIVVTDHAPHLLSEKEATKTDFANIPGGFPGVQSLLPALLALVAERTLKISDVVRLGASRPAALFGLSRKGKLEPGFDADLLVLDPGNRMTVRSVDLVSKARFTPFEGLSAPFCLESVFLRGVEVLHAGRLVSAPIGKVIRPEAR